MQFSTCKAYQLHNPPPDLSLIAFLFIFFSLFVLLVMSRFSMTSVAGSYNPCILVVNLIKKYRLHY
ncbi:hypothetical protein BDV25DRAFT_164516 [Aspergillus avenaceus]|uniref:Uncharacterized protein n=1 Tax=Aspergillus avenaceus TaxID=36643 RepID=A0A5N6TGT5_ASPAV|nr:hypothetical protein BDV25DRAFT_164516 [Aspergillus avenaceus]